MSQLETVQDLNPTTKKITRYSYIVLIATFLGWMMDAMDSSFFGLVLKPAVTDILGGSATLGQITSNGSFVMTTYLVGWATGGILFGLLTDYWGRVKVLTIGILMYSVFTGLCAVATSIPQLAVFRFLTGLGSGPEFAIGAALITEVWKSEHRAKAIGIMMSGYSAGYFLSAFLYYIISSMGYGWRIVFVIGIVPALLVLYIRRHLDEPEKWKEVHERRKLLKFSKEALTEEEKSISGFALSEIFKKQYGKITIIAIIIATAALIGNWAIGGWIPTIVNTMLTKMGYDAKTVAQKVSIVAMMYNAGGVLGYASWGFLADWWGRKKAFIFSMLGSTIASPIVFLAIDSYEGYMIATPFLGFFVFGLFSGLAIWLAEIYPTHIRGTGSTFCFNISRYLVAFAPLSIPYLVATFGSISKAAAVLSIFFVIGLIATFFVKETRNVKV
jgi:MFS family permease